MRAGGRELLGDSRRDGNAGTAAVVCVSLFLLMILHRLHWRMAAVLRCVGG